MKRKLTYMMVLAVTTGFVFAGCGDGVGEVGLFIGEEVEHPAVSVTAQPVNAAPGNGEEAEQGICILYRTGELTEAEEQEALEAMQLMYQNLELEEYLGEGLYNISSEKWMETFAVRLVEGSRTYYLQEDGEILLSVQVGYDIEGQSVSHVFFPVSDREVLLLRQSGSVTQLVNASTAEGRYDGTYELWQFDSATGNIRHEEGTYSAGVIVGEYTVSVREGTTEGAVLDMWNNRQGLSYEVTTLKYDAQGELIPEATPTPAPAATSKPAATPRPAATPQPAATPRPTPAPTPEPSYNDDNDDDDDDHDDGGSQDNGGNQDNGGGSAGGGNDSGSGGGADVDVEWSGDIL